MVELKAGDWHVGFSRSKGSDGPPSGGSAAKLKVTGDLPAGSADLPGAIKVNLKEYTFEIPDGVKPGLQIWHLTATGEQPHFMFLAKVPAGTTEQQVLTTMSFDDTKGATPGPEMLTRKDFQPVYSSSDISTGQSLWVQVDLKAGTYVAMCFVNDKATGAPHAMMGMVTVFTVA
ncbi:MAG: hypothetical protein ACR2OO_05910 [Thermomicrobiales bacterium]